MQASFLCGDRDQFRIFLAGKQQTASSFDWSTNILLRTLNCPLHGATSRPLHGAQITEFALLLGPRLLRFARFVGPQKIEQCALLLGPSEILEACELNPPDFLPGAVDCGLACRIASSVRTLRQCLLFSCAQLQLGRAATAPAATVTIEVPGVFARVVVKHATSLALRVQFRLALFSVVWSQVEATTHFLCTASDELELSAVTHSLLSSSSRLQLGLPPL